MSSPLFHYNASSRTSVSPGLHPSSPDGTVRKQFYSYHAPWPIFALDWSKRTSLRESFRLVVGSFLEGKRNYLQVISLESSNWNRKEELMKTCETEVIYPITKALWQPPKMGFSPDLIATSSDILRIWDVRTHDGVDSIYCVQELCSSKSDIAAPLTSFDWNETNPAMVVTCSVDTTCTIWDVEAKQAKTQLIAHDREVFDVTWITGTADIFASVGADGSVRMFDLRALDHSSIIYESPASSDHPPPLLRISANRLDPNYLACIHVDSSAVQVLDVRIPGTPIAELKGHSSTVNSISWAPSSSGHLCSGGDDAQVLVWDLRPSASQNSSLAQRAQSAPVGLGTMRDPVLAYTAPYEINQVSWSWAMPEWVAIAFGRTIQTLKM